MSYENPFEVTEDSLTEKLVFYIPSKRSDNTELGILLRATACHSVMNFLVRKLGGATMVEGKGYYVDKKERTHSENTTLCISYFKKKDLTKDLVIEIRDIANSLAVEFDQKALAVSLNEHLHFFEPTEAYRKIYNDIRESLNAKQIVKNGFRQYLD